jgi:hypothetical protein
MIEHRRLQFAARQWMAGKMRPKNYGDKVGAEPDGVSRSEIAIRVFGGYAEAFKTE